jgi:hypothetical protein
MSGERYTSTGIIASRELSRDFQRPVSFFQEQKPVRARSCSCGVPNCPGHEIRPDGTVHIPGHPKRHLVISLSKRLMN